MLEEVLLVSWRGTAVKKSVLADTVGTKCDVCIVEYCSHQYWNLPSRHRYGGV